MAGEQLQDWDQPPDPLPRHWYQNRGRAFEKIIGGLLSREGLEPRTNFRPIGEEIDGSFLFGERTYLLEAKWRKDTIPASDLYTFKGKVDGKLVGTIGVFISMSGFSDDAVDALKFGKEINLILFDERDFRLIESGALSFASALREKLRYAAEEGQPFLPLSPEVPQGEPPARGVTGPVSAPEEQTSKWQIVVEGETDALGLRIILSRLDPHLGSWLRFWPAGGQLAMASLLRKLKQSGHTKLAGAVDGDVSMEILDEVREEIAATGGPLLIIKPNLEDVLEDACPPDYINMLPATGVKAKAIRRVAAQADLNRLIAAHQELKAFVDRLREGIYGDQSTS